MLFGWGSWSVNAFEHNLAEHGVVTIATISSYDGSFLRGRRQRTEVSNYWVEYDGHRYHFQWPMRYQVGDRIRLVYDPSQPSNVRILPEGEERYVAPDASRSLVLFVFACAIFGIYSIQAAYRDLKNASP
jgi:hypothetical protein